MICSSSVDCMTCLVNVARGLEVEYGLHIRWHGIRHAAVWEMSSGLVVAACKYEKTDDAFAYIPGWQRKKEPT